MIKQLRSLAALAKYWGMIHSTQIGVPVPGDQCPLLASVSMVYTWCTDTNPDKTFKCKTKIESLKITNLLKHMF